MQSFLFIYLNYSILLKAIKHTPNFITVLNLSSGAISVTFAAGGEFYIAGILILIAALFDFLDGFFARILKSYSPIGGQLDSLADMISFGFAPAFLLHIYMKKLMITDYLTTDLVLFEPIVLIVLLSPLLLTAFAALRLAIFNIDERQSENFIGLPVPAMALFFVSAIISMEKQMINLNIHEIIWVTLVVFFSVLMVLSFPMFSLKFKNYRWKENKIQFIFVGISIILLVTLQTIGISLAVIMYIFLSGLINVLRLNRELK